MFDQFDDSNRRQLHALATVIELPEFVKTAAVADAEELRGLGPDCFADPAHRKFPVHTRHDAWMSRLYFAKNASQYKTAAERAIVAKRLEKAAELWQLSGEYETKPRELPEIYSVDVQDSAGRKIASWEIRSPRDVEKIAIQLFEDKNLFRYPQRRKMARDLLKCPMAKAASLKPEVAEYLERAAGFGMARAEDVMEALLKRAAVYNYRSRAIADKMAEVAEAVMDHAITPNILSKVAEVVDVCDETTGVRRNYSERFPTPEEELFRYTEKTAGEIKDSCVVLTNGAVVPVDMLKEAELDDYFEKMFGEKPVGDFPAKVAALKALPRPDADDFVQLTGLGKKAAESDENSAMDAERSERERKARGTAVRTGLIVAPLAAMAQGAISASGKASVIDALIHALATGAAAGTIGAGGSYVASKMS